MPKGMARSQGSSGEYISHFNAIRIRAIGTGSLKLTLYSLQDIRFQQLADLPLAEATNIQPTRLANFMEQRASLELGTTSINDYFRINRILVFTKPTFTSYPA
jgi:hypothetical protein